MTGWNQLVTAPPTYTLTKCVNKMRAGVFRHLPIVEGDQVKAVLSMRDIAQQIAAALAKQALRAARDPPTPLSPPASAHEPCSHANHPGTFRSRSPTPFSSPI